MDAIDLSPDESAALFGVTAGELRGWLTTGVPAPHLQRLAEIAAVAEILQRRLVPGRLPAVARRPAAAYGGDTVLDWLGAGRGGELLASIRYSSTWSDALVEETTGTAGSAASDDDDVDDQEDPQPASGAVEWAVGLRRHGVPDDVVAYVAGVDPLTIERWLAGAEPPSAEQAHLVGDLAAVAVRAGTVMKPSYVPVWLTKPIAALDGERPVDALRRGARQRVDQALASLEDPGAV